MELKEYKKETRPSDLRAILVAAIGGVIDGRINVKQANSIASLSCEIHKSLRLEKIDKILSCEIVTVKADGKIIDLLGEKR